MNRILRMYAPSLIGDHTLCYLHSDSQGKSTVNEVPLKLNYTHCGEALAETECEGFMTLVLPSGILLEDGDFLFVKEYETLLRWKEAEKCFEVINNGFIGLSDKIEILKPLKTAILSVNTSENEATPDFSFLAGKIAGEVTEVRNVTNTMEEIKAAVTELADKGNDLIITTGGVGITEKDIVPEAVTEASDRVIPGFGEVMRIKNLMNRPEMILNRSMAAVAGSTLIICLPGNVKDATECFSSISAAIRPAVEKIKK